jgi:hypothetical protein
MIVDDNHARRKPVVISQFKRPVRPKDGSTNDGVPEPTDYGSPADNSREPSANAYGMKNAAVAELEFPLCDAAVQKRDGSEWDLADAIVAECSETGDHGVRNGSYAKMEAMREEIAKNHGVALSLERVRKLRKVASAFPPGRRRPGVSLDGHLEAGTPEALDAFVNRASGPTQARTAASVPRAPRWLPARQSGAYAHARPHLERKIGVSLDRL